MGDVTTNWAESYIKETTELQLAGLMERAHEIAPEVALSYDAFQMHLGEECRALHRPLYPDGGLPDQWT